MSDTENVVNAGGVLPYAEVIGDPVAHSKSPSIHEFWLSHSAIAGRYGKVRVEPKSLGDYFATRRSDTLWRGCNATIPHKEAVLAHLDRVDPRAAAIGAVNTVWRDDDGQLCGTNTDVDGVAEAIDGADLAGRPVTVLGGGGAARAAFSCIAELGCGDLRVLARSPERAARAVEAAGMAGHLLPFAAGTGAFDDSALIINATQLGMDGQMAMPEFVLDELVRAAPRCVVFDMVYAPLETDLLARARAIGAQPRDGLMMLVGQAATAFERFFGTSPPRGGDDLLRKRLVT